MLYVRTVWPWGILAWSLAGSFSVATPVLSQENRPEIRIVRDQLQQPIAFEAVGLPEWELNRLRDERADLSDFVIRFYVAVGGESTESAEDDTIPVVAGNYSVENSVVRFTPRYPLLPGIDYRIVLQWEASEIARSQASMPLEKVEATLRIPQVENTERPKVQSVYPSGATVPENHLRFYIHFSTPMQKGSVYRFLELRDDTGEVVESAFLELTEELWDPRQTRLTLLLDPGRVKQSLQPREELGSVLKQGKSYQLIVRAGWANSHGVQLATDYEHEFTVGPPASEPLDAKQWFVSSPREGTADALSVRFPVALDHAIALRAIVVRDSDGDLVPGEKELLENETILQFTPKVQWTSGSYQLGIDPRLEDTAGNRLDSAFEVQPRFDGSTLDRPTTNREILVPIPLTMFSPN